VLWSNFQSITFKILLIWTIQLVPLLSYSKAIFNTKEGQLTKKSNAKVDSNQNQLLKNPHYAPYLNFKHPEFWAEGNHKPDQSLEILLEEVLKAGPKSQELAEVWLLRNEIKARAMELALPIIEKAQTRLVRAGLMKDRYNMVLPAYSLPNGTTNKFKIAKNDLESLEFFFLFSPTCPHCKSLAKNLVGFNNLSPLQISSGNIHHWPGLPNSEMASKKTINTYLSNGKYPVLVIHDPKSKNVVKLEGSKSKHEIMTSIAKLLKRRERK